MAGENLDVNSMYSILKDIFNRELNEGYSNRNRSNFAGGLADLRNGWAAMQNARKNKQNQAEYKNSMGNGGGNQYPNGSIGATGEGVYGVNSMPPQPTGGGIGVDANGMYGVNGTPQSNKYTFNESDYIPSAQNGYHLGDYKQTEMYGNPTDFQRQMASNAIGYNLGSFEPRQQTWFPKDGGEKPDNIMNITDQTIGQNYNNRINSQYGADKSGGMTGMNFPQTPQGNGGFNSVFNGANANPSIPSISSSNLAQGIGGQNVSANDLSRYLGNEYNRAAWIQQDMANNGVTNPLISMLRYDTKIAPLISAAKEEELRNAFFTLNNPDASEKDKMNAMALIEFRKGDPFLEEEFMAKLGYVPDDGYGGYGGYDDGGEYGGDDENARAVYNHLASLGLPANVIAGIMGNLQAESGFNSNAIGDGGKSIGLAQWYEGRGDNLRNFAQQRGKEWNDVGTQLDFLLDEVAKGNPDLLQRMANLSPHEAAILFHDEFEKSADSPELKARRGEYANGIYNSRRQGNGTRRSRWKQNPYKMTPMQRMQYQHDLRMEEIAERNKYRDQRNNPTKIKPLSPQDQESAIDTFANADKPDKQQGHKIGQAWAGQFANYYEKMGSEEDAAIQMYYDYAAMNPKQRGWSMSPEKLATAVGYAAAHAKGLDGINATNYAGSVTQYILGNMSSGGSSPKTGGTAQTGNKGTENNMSAPDYQQGGNGGSSSVGTGGGFLSAFKNATSAVGDVAQWARANKNTQIGSGKFGSDVKDTVSGVVDKNKKILQEERDKYKKEEEAKRLRGNVGARVR